jgi:hypothetical protein
MLARNRLLTLLYAAAGAAGYLLIFVLPWHVSPGVPSVSDSYALGFSNRASLAGVLVTCVALFILSWASSPRAPRALIRTERAPDGERIHPLLIAGAVAITLAAAVFFIWLAGSRPWGEMAYFMDRLSYLVGGKVPYRDFEFDYGPALLYVPYLAWRLLQPLGISLRAAYEIVFVAMFCAGVPLIAYVVDRLELPKRQRTGLFIALWVPVAVNETLGIQGMVLRFLLPAAAIVFLHGQARTALGRTPSRAAVRLWLAAVLGAVACYAMSPEIGVAALLALGAYLATLAVTGRRREALPALGGLALSGVVVVAAAGTSSVVHLIAVSGGALNFPVVPSPTVLVLLAAALGSAVLLPRYLSSAGPGTPATLALATAAAVMLAGAFGRADGSHLLFDGMLAACLAAAVFAATSRRLFTTYAVAFAVIFVGAHALTLQHDYGKLVVMGAVDRGASSANASTLAGVLGLGSADTSAALAAGPYAPGKVPDMAALRPYAPLAAMWVTPETRLALAGAGILASPYFRDVPYTEAELAIQLDYLDRAGHVIMPASDAADLPTDAAGTKARRTLGGDRYGSLLMWPQVFPVSNRMPDLKAELAAHLLKHFKVVAQFDGYAVMVRSG